MLVSSRLMSKQDAVISTYIHDFIDRAYAENATFYELTKADKMKIMYNYADEKLKRNQRKRPISTTNIRKWRKRIRKYKRF